MQIDLSLEELRVVNAALMSRMVMLNTSSYRHRMSAVDAKNESIEQHFNDIANRESAEWRIAKAVHDTISIIILTEVQREEDEAHKDDPDYNANLGGRLTK